MPEGTSIFLAGSIDQGKAVLWQDEVEKALKDYAVVIYNPRRDDWDPNLRQAEDEPDFAEQVNWELDRLEACDIIFMHFDPKGKGPISLMELGLHIGEKPFFLVCPEGYWRKGNVDIVSDRHGVKVYETLEEGIESLCEFLKTKNLEERFHGSPDSALLWELYCQWAS